MNIDSIKEYSDAASEELGKYIVQFMLPPKKLLRDDYVLNPLAWDSIPYGDAQIDQVPNDKRGIYAFVISVANDVVPPNGYVVYIGIAGRKSDRNLRARYRDYLNEKKVLKRSARIIRMIANWNEVLRFHFAPVDDTVTSEELEKLEEQLSTAFLPPFSEGDIEGETKAMRRAF